MFAVNILTVDMIQFDIIMTIVIHYTDNKVSKSLI